MDPNPRSQEGIRRPIHTGLAFPLLFLGLGGAIRWF
jgi:hypothetical protein